MENSMEDLVALQKRLVEAMQKCSHKTYTLLLNAGGISTLHALICIAERSSEIQDLGGAAEKFIPYLLDCCKDAWSGMGLSKEDINTFEALRREDWNG